MARRTCVRFNMSWPIRVKERSILGNFKKFHNSLRRGYDDFHEVERSGRTKMRRSMVGRKEGRKEGKEGGEIDFGGVGRSKNPRRSRETEKERRRHT